MVSQDEELIKKARFLATQARDPEVHSQHTKVKIKNKEGWFNSVHFEVID